MAAVLQDPLSSAAPVLGAGPSALDIGYKRMGMEQADAALKQQKQIAADKIKEKQDAANAKAFALDLDTVQLPDTLAFHQKMADEDAWLADKLQAYSEGKGGDPRDPTTKEGMERLARGRTVKQWVSNSKQKMDLGNTELALVRARPFDYEPGAEEEIIKWQSDPSVNDSGAMRPPSRQFYNLDKAVQTQLGALAESGGGQAITLDDGSIKTTSSEYILPKAVLDGVQLVLQNPYAKDEALRRFVLLDKDSQDAVAELAAKNNITKEEAMIWNEAAPVYSYNKYKETLQQPSESGAGRMDMQEGLNWLAEWRKGAEEGKYEGDAALNLFGVTTGGDPVPGVPEAYKTLKGWVFDQTEVYDPTADKNIKKETTIQGIKLDRGKEKWVITLDNGEVRQIPTEKFESEVIPRLGAYNKDKLAGVGSYINSAKKSGYFQDIKGGGTEEMVKTDNKNPSGAFVPGKKSTGAFVPGK